MNLAPILGLPVNGGVRGFVPASAGIAAGLDVEARGSRHTTAAAHAVGTVTVQPTATAMRMALASLGACADLQPWARATAGAAANLRPQAAIRAEGVRHIGAVAAMKVGAEGRAAALRSAYTWAHASGSLALQASAARSHGATASVWAVAELLANGRVAAMAAAQLVARAQLDPVSMRPRYAAAKAGAGVGLWPAAQTNASAQDHEARTFTRPVGLRQFSRQGRAGREFLRPALGREFWRSARIEFMRTP